MSLLNSRLYQSDIIGVILLVDCRVLEKQSAPVLSASAVLKCEPKSTLL